MLYYFQDRLLRYCWGCDVKYIGSGYSIGIAGGIMEFFRDFEDAGRDRVLLKTKIPDQYSDIYALETGSM